MCTASWLTEGDRFHFLFNRDERLTRAAGRPPERRFAEGVAYLSPIDPESEGTWLAVTERGLLLALLNRSVAGRQAPAGSRSRGTLIPELAPASSIEDLARRIAALDLAECAPFRLFAHLGERAALGAVWDGRERAVQSLGTASGLLCSSSLGDLAVTRSRSELWSARRREIAAHGLDELRRFHRSHLPERGPASVCMHRDDAQTVSHLELLRTPDAFHLTYFDGPPCTASTPVSSSLPISTVAAS